jgi:Right handed beta helix region
MSIRLKCLLPAVLVAGYCGCVAAAPVACPTEAGGVDITKAPYSASTDGRTDVSASFKRAVDDPSVKTICLPPGKYLFKDEVFLRTGQDLSLLGLSTDPKQAQVVWNSKVNPFHSSPTRGLETRIRSFTVKNLTFDGGGSEGRAFNLLASPDAGDGSFVDISNSIIQNTTELPVWIEGFAKVRIANSKFFGTKDPGILRSGSVEIVSNEVENSSDNCMSVSRGNRNVVVARNHFKNCRSAGIFVGGIDYKGDTKKSFTIDGDGPLAKGSPCKIRSSDLKHFRYGMIGTNVTLNNGGDHVIVNITGWDKDDTGSAPCVLATAAPRDLVGRATSDWNDGPHFGGDGTVIENNVIDGSLGHGITLSLGVKNVRVLNNKIISSGRFVNADGSVKSAESFGILVVGWFLGRDENAQRYAENIEIRGNTIMNASAGGVRLGSQTTGGTRNVVVDGNQIDLSGSDARIGVLLDEHPGMPSMRNRIEDNDVRFSKGTKNGYAVRVDAHGDQICTALQAASVERMTGGSCAIFAGATCEAAAAPARVRCDGQKRKIR